MPCKWVRVMICSPRVQSGLGKEAGRRGMQAGSTHTRGEQSKAEEGIQGELLHKKKKQDQ